MISFDGLSVCLNVRLKEAREMWEGGNLHSSKINNLFGSGGWIRLDSGDRSEKS